MRPAARRVPASGERALTGVSAAPGIAMGKAVVVGRAIADSATIPLGGRQEQLERARAALVEAAAELEALASRLRTEGRDSAADIVETGVLMAHDPTLDAALEELVLETGLPAPDALREAAEDIAGKLAALVDPLLAERADDVRSLGRRAAARAAGMRDGVNRGVLVASSLGPADVAELGSDTQGVALAGGGVTAHAAIVARSLGLPMVVGLGEAILEVVDGEEVVLDGDLGVLVRLPGATRVAGARAEVDRHRLARERAVAGRYEPAETKDRHRVRVLANAAGVAEVLEALEQGAEGVGLLRTELLFLEAGAWPRYEQHLRFLKPILAPLAGQTATVRLLDFGGDKTPPFLAGAHGRGVELLLSAPDALAAQLAAILDAGRSTRLRILIPMVTALSQVRAVREALATVLDGRRRPEVGAMIETPEAAHRARELATEVDFMSVGTNDLTQLTLGLDRERSVSAPTMHPAVLRLIDSTMRAGRAAGIPVDVCGEAASDPLSMAVLVGLGADELSVAATRVGLVRERIRAMDFAACQSEAEGALLDQRADAAGEGV
jgi:phosphoenolpyruvate-protein phosphotransferase